MPAVIPATDPAGPRQPAIADPPTTAPATGPADPVIDTTSPGPLGPAAGQAAAGPVAVSATLAANETLDRMRRSGEPVLHLAFGEAGLPAHPALRQALADATGRNGYGPVIGLTALREAAAGYWHRRGLPTDVDAVVCGPGSKALLFALLLAIGADVAVPQPSWVSYAAQASLIGCRSHFVPTPPGQGGVPDPDLLARAVSSARAAGRRIRSVIVTLPDNPTGTLASPGTVRRLCEVAAKYDLIIISDEIYRDLIHDPRSPFMSPAVLAPERSIVTTALSKSLALGGWRIGVARLPEGKLRRDLRERLTGIGSEIWSAPAGPMQQAAAYAFADPPELTERIARSRRLHAIVARGVADRFAAAGAIVPSPQAAFYLYPDFGPRRHILHRRHGVTTAAGLATLLLERYGTGVLPGSAFGEERGALRLRVATGLLYGETEAQREAALAASDPLTLPTVASALARIEEILTDLI